MKVLERAVETLAVIKHSTMMIGNPPRPGIEIKSLLKLAGLRETAKLGERVATTQCRVATSWTTVAFKHLNTVTRLAQFQRCGHACQTGAKDQDGRASDIAAKLDAALVSGIGCEPEAGHRVVHRRAAGHRTDQRQKIAPAKSYFVAVLHRCSTPDGLGDHIFLQK